MSNTPHDLVQSQPQSHVSYTSIGGGRAPVMFSARIETAEIGVNVTQRAGRKPAIEIDGDKAYTRRALTELIDMLTAVRDQVAPEPKLTPCVGLRYGIGGEPPRGPDPRWDETIPEHVRAEIAKQTGHPVDDARNDPRLHTSRPISVSPEVQKVLDEEGVKLVPLVDTGVGDARPVSLGG